MLNLFQHLVCIFSLSKVPLHHSPPIAEEEPSCYISVMMTPKSCRAYYYGGLPTKGSRRRGRMWVDANQFYFEIPGGKGGERIQLKISFSEMSKIFLSRDNYYGVDTVLFNLTFRDQADQSFTLRFAPITLIPRRRIALQKQWFDYLANTINSLGSPSPLPTK